MSSHKHALDKAKIALMSRPDSVFFTTVCFSLKHLWDEEVPTAGTDGTQIRFNPNYFMGLSTEQQVFLLLHETLHVAYMHMLRVGTRDRHKWNIAADHVINLQLLNRGYVMPQGGYADAQYQGLSVEQVYDLLPDPPEGPDPMMDLEEPNGSADGVQKEVEDILIRAAIQSKQGGDKPGTIPGEVEIFLNKLLNPKLPWYQIVRRFFNTLQKNDYSWRKPNRRYFPDFYLPSFFSEGLGHIALAIDASGSVSDNQFLHFVSETEHLIKQFKPTAITLIQFDNGIRKIDVIKNTRELMNVKFKGRGGTDVTEVMQWALDNKPQALLVFTDGEFRFPRSIENPKIPLIWLIHNRPSFNAPYGKVIHYELDE